MLSHALLIKLLQVKKYRLLQIFPPVIQRYGSVQTVLQEKDGFTTPFVGDSKKFFTITP